MEKRKKTKKKEGRTEKKRERTEFHFPQKRLGKRKEKGIIYRNTHTHKKSKKEL